MEKRQGWLVWIFGNDELLDPATTALGASNSIDIWFKRRASINSANIIFSRLLPYFSFSSNGKFLYSNRINAAQCSISSTGTYSDGIWYNAVCTTDYALGSNVSTMRLYVDGELSASGTFSGIQSNYGTSIDRIMIGAHLNGIFGGDQYYYYFDGDIGEVRVRNRSMSAAEISASYSKRKTRYK